LRLKLAAVFAVTAACMLWVLWGIDLEKVQVSVEGIRWSLLGAALATYLFVHGLRAWRFQLLVPEPVSYGRMFSICSVGFLAINVVPLRLGEFVRPYLLMEQEGVSMGGSLAGVVLERLLDMLMMLGLLLLVAVGLDLPGSGIVVADVDIIAAGQRIAAVALTGGTIFLAALAIGGEAAARRFGGWLRWVPVIGEALPGFLVSFSTAPRQLFARPGVGLGALALSLGVWIFTIVAVGLSLLAFEGLPHTVTAAITVWTVTMAGMIAVPTPGFFGAYEAFCLAALLLWQVDIDAARTFAVVLHLSQFFFTIALGGTFLVREGLSLRALVEQSRQVGRG